MRVRFAERAVAAVGEHIAGSGVAVACGLLIGRRDEQGELVERTLRCFNAAPAGARDTMFEIDPRVLVNVRRSLAATGGTILGVYYGGRGNGGMPTERDHLHLRLWPYTTLLIGTAGAPAAGLRAWRRESEAAEAAEIEIELVPTPPPSMLVCPE